MENSKIESIMNNVVQELKQEGFLNNNNQNDSNSDILERMDGLTNFTFKFIDAQSASPRIARWALDDFEGFMNRDTERLVLKTLEECNLYPKIHFYGKKLKVEDFIKNDGTLEKKDLLQDSSQLKILNQALRKVYTKITPKLLSNKTKVSKMIFFIKNFKQKKTKILENIKFFVSKEKLNNYTKIFTELEKYCEDLEKYHALIKSPLVITHGDLNPFNILKIQKNERENDLQIIDYEYAGPNLILYDIANLVHELQSEYSPQFSIFEVKSPANRISEDSELENQIDCVIESFRQSFADFLDEYSREEFLELVYGFRAYNFFFWICLTIDSEKMSQGLDFDFYNCANLRFQQFIESFKILENFFNTKYKKIL